MFRNWGRLLTLLGFALTLSCTVFMGPAIEQGFESALNELLATCYGAIIASIYLQPIAAEFDK